MNKIVVPIDFSDTSKNAARYAIQMAKDLGDCEIILYNVYDEIVAGSDGTPLYNDDEARNTISLMALANVKLELEEPGVTIICRAEPGQLVTKLEKLVKDDRADFVVMGINGASRLDQLLIGSSTIGVINRNFCPVIIIPPEAIYRKIKSVVLLSDFKNVAQTTPMKALKKTLNLFRPHLCVAYAYSDPEKDLSEEYKSEKPKLELLLTGYNPEFALIPLKDFGESVDHFVMSRGADLVITVPHRHSFLSTVFKSTHTRKLAYHTHLPILALHE